MTLVILSVRRAARGVLRRTRLLSFYRHVTGAARYPPLGPTGSAKTQIRLQANMQRSPRRLEIGPGPMRLSGFETLDIVDGPNIDYVCDATEPLPFPDATFELVYASHILEHVPWYQSEGVLNEWTRIIVPGGRLELWVPDGLKICQALVEAELNDNDYTARDGWYRWNEERDPCKWAAGRIFTYGDGQGNVDSPNWHRALFTPRYLRALLERCGLRDIRLLEHKDVRGYDHGWISLGMGGVKS